MKTFYTYLTVVILAVLVSCSGNNETENTTTSDTTTTTVTKKSPFDKEKLLSHINDLEKQIPDTAQISRGVGMDLMISYAKYATLYPKDSLSPEFLLKAADIARAIGEGRNAVNYYKRILNDYPSYEKRPITMFLLAFTYENSLNDTANARKYYTEFIKKYPNHEFADNARQLLKLLGKDLESIVKQFDKK